MKGVLSENMSEHWEFTCSDCQVNFDSRKFPSMEEYDIACLLHVREHRVNREQKARLDAKIDTNSSLSEAVIRFEMLARHGIVKRKEDGRYEMTHEGAKQAIGLLITAKTLGDNTPLMVGAAVEILKSEGYIEGRGPEDETQELRLTPLGAETYISFLLNNNDPDKPVAVEGLRELLEETA